MRRITVYSDHCGWSELAKFRNQEWPVMDRELRIIQLAIERLKGRCDPSVINELTVYEMRIVDLAERSRRFGETREISAARMEVYYSFQSAYEQHSLDRIAPRNALEGDVAKREQFEALSPIEKLDYYSTRLADYMQNQLRNQSAHDVMYVPLHAVYLRYGESKSGKSQPRRGRSTRLVERIAKYDDPILIVRGLPGTGKSVAMRQVVRTVATRAVGNVSALIPLFIPLGQIGHVTDPNPIILLKHISAYLRGAYHLDYELALGAEFVDQGIPSLLHSGRCLFIFDGMDELPKQGYDETCRNLLTFARHWTDKQRNRCVFSCREFDYPKELRIDSLVIFPFEWSDVEQYLKLHLPPSEYSRRGREARHLWKQSRAARSMLDNPFFLHLATRHILERPNDPLPANRGPLFDSYVERVFRNDQNINDANASTAIRHLLERLALWLTDTKASGTSASLADLRQSAGGASIAKALAELDTSSVLRYFLDTTPDSVTFRHHRLREFFAALALKKQYFSDGPAPDNDHVVSSTTSRQYFRTAAADIWYFETIVMLASLLPEGKTTDLVEYMLDTDGEHPSAYRAILAAECLDASPARHSRQLCARVFSTLVACIDDEQTGVIEKVEGWQALGRLQLTAAQLERLTESISDGNRFVLEQALCSFADLSDQRIAKCQPAALRLLTSAAKLAAMDRLLKYWRWMKTPAFRDLRLSTFYLFAWLTSLAFWCGPSPALFLGVAAFAPPIFFWWMLPGAGAACVFVIQAFFWFNEDKRSVVSCLNGLHNTTRHLGYRKPVPPKIPRRKEIGRPPVASNAQRLSEYDKWSLLSLLATAEKSADVAAFLASEAFIPNSRHHKHGEEERIRQALLTEFPKVADLVDCSSELGYKIPRSAVADICRRIVSHDGPVLGSIAQDVVFSLRREARKRTAWGYLRYDQYASVPDTNAYRLSISSEEAEFMLQPFAPHNYACMLLANQFMDSTIIDLAEKCESEPWLADAAAQLFREVKRMIAASGQPVPRQAVRGAFDKLAEGLSSPERQRSSLEAALHELGEDTLRGFERLRALQSVARMVVTILLLGGLVSGAVFFYYYQVARRHAGVAAQQTNRALEQEKMASNAHEDLVARKSGPPPARRTSLRDRPWFEKWDLADLATATGNSDDPAAFLVAQGFLTSVGTNSSAVKRDLIRRFVSELQIMAQLVDVSTELNYRVSRETVAELFSRLPSTGLYKVSNGGVAAKLVYDLRQNAREGDRFEHLRYRSRANNTGRQEEMEMISTDELAFVSKEWQDHGYLTILYSNGLIASSVISEAETSKTETSYANASRQLLRGILGRSTSAGVPRSCVIAALRRLVKLRHSNQLSSIAAQLDSFEGDVRQWSEAKQIATEAARRAQEAREAAEQEQRFAREAQQKQIELSVFIVVIVLPTTVWLSWRYVLPRVGLLSVDVTLPAGVARLLAIAVNGHRDMALRKAAVRKLAFSDDASARQGLQQLVNEQATPEPLSIEAHRALHEVQRRRMRAGAT